MTAKTYTEADLAAALQKAEEQHARAYEIADVAMLTLLTCEAIPIAYDGAHYHLYAYDESEAVQETLDWLVPRGIVKIEQAGDRMQIRIIRHVDDVEPGEE